MAISSGPVVSIVIPTYNHAGVLQRALQSVMQQTFTDWEAIVINNYSTDNTIAVVESFRDPRIRLINFRNQGVIAASRNVGIKAARGEYIAFLDSDDSWYPEKIEKILDIFNKKPEVDLVCHDIYAVSDGRIKEVYKAGFRSYYNISNERLHHALLFGRRSFIYTSATTVRKAKMVEVGGFRENPGFISCEDYDLWLRLSLTSQFYFLNVVLGEYHILGLSASRNIEYHGANMVNLFEFWFKDLYQKSPGILLRWKIRRRLAVIYRTIARGYLQRSAATDKQRENIIKMLQLYPFGIKNLATAGWWLGRNLRKGKG